MDNIAFCRRFFAATNIPIHLLKGGKPLYSSIAEVIGYMPQTQWPIYDAERNPEFASLTPDLEYGHVHVEGKDYDIFIGPIFTTPVNEALIDTYFAEIDPPQEYRDALTEMLYSIPIGSHAHFVRYLSFLHLIINHVDSDEEALYQEPITEKLRRSHEQLETTIETKENETPHSSYEFELQLHHYVEMGNANRLKAFLDGTRDFPTGGKMARSPLRQVKNLFISLAVKLVVMAAIPGGMDVEKAYQLSELYVLECEQMQTPRDIYRLQYIMLMDFCQRIGEVKMPKGLSSEIYRSIHYIQNHTNEAVSIDEVAAHIHRSPSYLMRRFKAETGMKVGEYITRCKLEEACDLLAYSARGLADISAYLGYSSQSYFQNVFKKQYGVTPMQYRKEKQRTSK